jgi:hypothetical protein
MTLAVQMDEATLPRRTDRHRGCGIEIWVLPIRELLQLQPYRKRNCPFQKTSFYGPMDGTRAGTRLYADTFNRDGVSPPSSTFIDLFSSHMQRARIHQQIHLVPSE